ncbi:hypothetical protein EJ06DRAFT_558353 [Trichodelitschia bisporula]|uniref:Mediator complex subunit 27 n=1 Tax=Trichodelitschia bisporula TaxID=703511 RepID=A0A6G1HR53_9PEZI|nr:hypothetical protein EJ06DRAFT_558353 [Trichodelitschia bisporula]
MDTKDALAGDPSLWSEEEYILSLARIEMLQDKLNKLRTAPGDFIHSTTKTAETPEELYQGISTTFNAFKDGVGDFLTTQSSPEIKKIYEHAEACIKADPDLDPARSKTVDQYGWVDKAKERGLLNNKEEEKDEGGPLLSNEEMSQAMANLVQKYPWVKASWMVEQRMAEISFHAVTIRLRFKVTVENRNSKAWYTVSVSSVPPKHGTDAFLAGINSSFSQRPSPVNDLPTLLEMIISYQTVRSAKCTICNKVLDDKLNWPDLRCLGPVSSPAAERVYLPYHKSCFAGAQA